MSVEVRPIFLSEHSRDLGFSSRNLNPEFGQNVSKDTIINAGAKIAGATIFTIGLIKLANAENLGDFIIGAGLVYLGGKIFTYKAKKAA